MISSLFPKIRALILDMDGVLWQENEPIGDLPRIFALIRSLGLKVTLATNNSTRTVAQYQDRLESLGVSVEPWQIVTSGIATAELLARRFPNGGPVYLVGEAGIKEALEQKGFYLADENVLAVIAGIDRQISFEKLRRATLLIRRGAPFYGTNPDRTFPTPEGLILGAGAILAALETATDISPIIAGKPEKFMMEVCLSLMGTVAQETLVVGDRLETDILSGQNCACRTALVLSGVTSLAQAQAWRPQPDLIVANLQTMLELE
ncbi:MAG TPA: HAD-IIA family hydrolase [Anaerolineaceae bacterium]|nr:HAD-IIA family hydrolase [Anaerolineaceae bacterium]